MWATTSIYSNGGCILLHFLDGIVVFFSTSGNFDSQKVLVYLPEPLETRLA
jgi:hypothetical protein